MDITSTSELYSSKQSFPYLVRTASSDYYQVGIVKLEIELIVSQECYNYFFTATLKYFHSGILLYSRWVIDTV